MGRRAILRLVGVLTVVVGSLVAAAAPADGETTVHPNGNVVTITIPVDVLGAADWEGPGGQDVVKYWKEVIEQTWGDAFARIPYKNCYLFKVKLDLKSRPSDFPAAKSEHRHRIGVAAPTESRTFDGTGFDGVPETSRDPILGDGTRSMEHDRDGLIPADAPPTVVAHEFGHLLGLGDDREYGAPSNGRNGTMMVGGVTGVDVNVVQEIDKNLIDRLGRIIERRLEQLGKKLTPCETWNGTIDGTLQTPGCSPVSQSGTVTIAVRDDGSIAGRGTTHAGAFTCDNGASIPTMSVSYAISGTKTSEAFELSFSDGVQLRARIHGRAARATQDTGAGTVTIELKCRNCDEDRVG